MTLLPATALLVAITIGGCAGDESDRPSREDCTRLFDHVADLTIAQSSATMSREDADAHRKNLAASANEQSLDACVKTRSRAFVECGLAAKTMAELERCSKSK